MIKIVKKEMCCGCYACVSVCPKQCITMEKDSEGFVYPLINETMCVDCGLCEKTCPEINYNIFDDNFRTEVFMGYATEDSVRLKSSSGGLFRLIAENIIDKNGVVFGAAWDEAFKLKHVSVVCKQDLHKIMGSKYVQSEIGDCYKQAKYELDQGRIVLFAGTPCQINGLLNFLDKVYTNLVTVDFICHGVPSPKIWLDYLQMREKQFGSQVLDVSFRDKSTGWKNFSFRLTFENGKEYAKTHHTDSYMKLFLDNYSLRPSCYKCSFKTVSRKSDITLADFWGCERFFEIKNIEKGVSLAFIHSAEGARLLNSIAEDILFKQAVDVDSAIKFNSAMVLSSTFPSKRSKFFSEIFNGDIDEICNKYCREKLGIQIKMRVIRILKCFLRRIQRKQPD